MGEPDTPPPGGELQFEKAEFRETVAEAPSCAVCRRPLLDEYFSIGGMLLCAECRAAVQEALTGGSGARRALRAVVFGVPTAAAGTAVYFAVTAMTGYEFALVAILVGWMVGKAVRYGSDNRGGRGFQVLAMLLTYSAIVATYVPTILKVFSEQRREAASQPAPTEGTDDPKSKSGERPAAPAETAPRDVRAIDFVIAVVVIFGIACAAPFLAGAQNIIGLFIIAVALYQAWVGTRRVHVEISGPFRIAPGAASGGAAHE